MNYNRIQMLQQEMNENPDDPFFIYALALEYKGKEAKKCLELLNECVKNFPDYLPTYYQLAELQIEFGEKDNALASYDKGIDLANKLKDLKTLAELRNAKQNLLFEED